MKKCSRCNLEKSLTEFYRRGSKRKDATAYCKTCHLQYMTNRLQNLKIRVIELMGGICQDCQQSFHPAVFQLHHLDPSQKDAGWSRLKYRSWESILKEIAKCVMLCANCHCLRHVDTEHYANG